MGGWSLLVIVLAVAGGFFLITRLAGRSTRERRFQNRWSRKRIDPHKKTTLARDKKAALIKPKKSKHGGNRTDR